tara:strand:- start:423 stop:3077 length:2655 start_codon:yes stop_codon:yes gene_type:complete
MDEPNIQTHIIKKEKKITSLYEFLDERRVSKGNKYTHTSMSKGSFYIDQTDYKQFLKLYYNHVFKNDNKAYLTEKHLDIAPILIDCDLKFNSKKRDRQYTHDHIKKLLSYYREFLLNHIEIENNSQLLAYIFEKTKPVLAKNNNELIVKDGIHIIFPNINLHYSLQFMMRDFVISHCDKIFGDLELTNSYSDVVDESVIKRNNWLMYGSRKPAKYGVVQEAYKLTKIYDLNNETFEEIENTHSNKELVKLLSIQYTRNFLCKIKEGVDKLIEDYNSKNKKKIRKKRKIKNIKRKKKSPKKKAKDEDLKIYKKLVKILSDERADNYKSWYDVGLCLHNIDYRLIEDWIDFSKKSSKYREGECNIEWDSMTTDELGLSIGSLYMWAKQDNHKAFEEIISEDLKTYIYRSLKNCSHSDIAAVVHAKFKHNYVCASNKSKIWFHFKNHRWFEIDNGVTLRRELSKAIVGEYRDYNMFCGEMAKSKPDEEDIWDDRGKTCHKIICKLKDVGFKEKIMKECADLFYINKFYEKLDSKRHLLGFENGVYDLEKDEFRDGIPEDYLSNSTKINYIEFNDDDDAHIENIEIFLEQILPNEAVRNYVMKLFSSFLSGKTGDEKIHFWTGSGGNGKSKIIELFEMGFGDYACKLPVSIFSKGRAASNACTPELVRTKGKRFASLQEPDANVPFNVGLMKELTGGDTIMARGLHKDPIEFKPQFKLIMTCNHLPEIQPMDGGTERRLRVINFESEFVEDPDPENPLQFKRDNYLDEKMEQWPEIFMKMLINKYKDYKKYGNKEPPEIIYSTNEYKKDCDIFNQFIDDKIEENPEEKIKIGELFYIFKMWFNKCGTSKKVPNRKDLKKAMNKRFGGTGTVWVGIGIKRQLYAESDSD